MLFIPLLELQHRVLLFGRSGTTAAVLSTETSESGESGEEVEEGVPLHLAIAQPMTPP